MRLSRGTSGSLPGVALARDGFSIAGISVALHSVARSIDRNLVTDADGIFIARDLPAGPYQVVATKGFSIASSMTVEVVMNRTANASLLLPDAKPIPVAQTTPAQTLSPASAQAQYAPPKADRSTAPVAAAAPAVDTRTPFAFGDFTWLNGTPPTRDIVADPPFFKPEVRFDTHYVTNFDQPTDHTIVG